MSGLARLLHAQYNWPGPFKPYDHQRKTTEFIVRHNRCCVLNDMGTGKTASALWAADFLLRTQQIRKVLIVAPLATLENVWRRSGFELLTKRKIVVLHGDASKRKALYDSSWDIGVINFDGVRVLSEQIAADKELDMLIVDEASELRNGQTARFKLFYKLFRNTERLVLMTGTPTPEAPTDAWALAKLISNPRIPKSWGAWRRATMQQISPFQWKALPDAHVKVHAVLEPAIRYNKEDCIDLPPVTTQVMQADLNTAQTHAYRLMQKLMKVEWANSEDGEPLTASHAADRVNKLRQIATGVLRDTENREYVMLGYEPRYDVLSEIVSRANSKVIVVVPFKGAIYELLSSLQADGVDVAMINGSVTIAERNRIVNAFQNTPRYRVLLAHPRVMSHGLTLTAADTMVFWGPIYSNDQALQVVERINRPGQTRPMTIYRLTGTYLESQIYKRVDGKSELGSSVVQLYREALDSAV